MDEQKDPSASSGQALPLPQEQLPEPHDMLLRPPTFWEKYHNIFSWLIPLVVLLILGTVGIVYVERTYRNLPPPPSPTPSVSPTTTADPTASWTTYKNDQYGWEMKYPDEVTVKELPAAQVAANGNLQETNFAKVGKTQKEGTEFFDGMSLTVTVTRKPATQTLEDFTDTKTAQEDPQSAKRTYFREVQKNGLTGYEAQVEGLGTFNYLFLPHGVREENVIWISYMSVGPDKEQYDKIIEQMLASFTFTDVLISVPPNPAAQSDMQVMCTMDAKVCPDGSSVGRTGPNCEFAKCPGE